MFKNANFKEVSKINNWGYIIGEGVILLGGHVILK